MLQVSRVLRLVSLCAVAAIICSCAVAQVRIGPADGPLVVRARDTAAYTMPPSGTYLQLEGITGSGPEGAMSVNDWQFGSFASTGGAARAGAGGGAGRSGIEELVILKGIDAATPLLFLRTMEGRVITNGEFQLDLQNAMLRLVMTNVRVVATSHPMSTEQVTLTSERITLTAEEYTLIYEPATGDPVQAGWNVRENRSLP